MNLDNQFNAPPVYAVWGTSIPNHWYVFLGSMAEEQGLVVYSLLRHRMTEKGLTDHDIEIMAERNRIPTLNQKQQLIAAWFKDDGLPEWQLPAPKTRRVMTKGRKAVRGPKKKVVMLAPITDANGVAVRLRPGQLDKFKALATIQGMPPSELATRIIGNWLNLQPDPEAFNASHAVPEPD